MPDGTVEPGPAIPDSLTQAQALVSYTLLEPDRETLPPAMQVTQVLWWPRDERGVEVVTITYEGGEQDLAVMQINMPLGMAAPTEPHESLVARGHKGYLVSSGSAHAFAWEEKQGAIHVGVFVSSGNLGLEALLCIVEGLRALGGAS